MIAEDRTTGREQMGLESIHLLEGESGRLLRLVSGLPVKEKDAILRKSKRLGDVGNRVLAFYLFDMEERGEAQLLGFPSAVDYARKRLDLPRRTARELIEVGEALRGLQKIDGSFALGEISWSRVRLLASLATPETEEAWLSAAKELSWADLELQGKLAKKGEMPQRDRKGLPEMRLKVPIVLNPLTHEFWVQAKKRLSAEHGEPITDAEALVELMRRYLQAPMEGSTEERRGEDARAFRVSVQWCPSCETPEVATNDGPSPIDPKTVAPFLQEAEVTTEKESIGQGQASVAQQHDRTTPEWMRDLVLARDGFRCLHCQSQKGLMVHHIVWRSRGGATLPTNLATCCTRCHVLIHAECLVVRGEAPHGLSWFSNTGESTMRPARDDATLRIRIPDSLADPAIHDNDSLAITRDLGRPSLPSLPTEIDSVALEALIPALSFCDRRGAFHYDADAPMTRPRKEPPVRESQGDGEGSSHRPEGLNQVLGQRRTVAVLKEAVLAAHRGGEAMAHTLLLGGPGLGKSSLMRAAARDLGTQAHLTSGPHLRDLGVLLQLVLRLKSKDILGIDEIHALPPRVAEALYEAMEDSVLTLPVTDGTQVRTLRFRLPPFTVIGATTETAALPKPLVMRFALRELLEWYETKDLAEIVTRAAHRAGLFLAPEAARVLARAGRDTPREALALFTRLKIAAIAAGLHDIDAAFTIKTLSAHGIDHDGLGPLDRRLLDLLQSRRDPIGLERLATLLGTTAEILRDVHEPFLVRRGLLLITPRGRMISSRIKES